MNHSTKKPTKAEQARLDAIHLMRCIACAIEGMAQPQRTEAHHLVDMGTRELSGGHEATIPLCGWHHRAEPTPYNKRRMLDIYGPTLQEHKKQFIAKYGTERDLLAKTNERLEETLCLMKS